VKIIFFDVGSRNQLLFAFEKGRASLQIKSQMSLRMDNFSY